jgi:predicted RNase H-like HicB family nuclease
MTTRELPPSTVDDVLAELGPLHAVYVESDGWISVYLLELPGAISQGRTIEEAREMVLAAARAVIAAQLSEGWPIERVPVVAIETLHP